MRRFGLGTITYLLPTKWSLSITPLITSVKLSIRMKCFRQRDLICWKNSWRMIQRKGYLVMAHWNTLTLTKNHLQLTHQCFQLGQQSLNSRDKAPKRPHLPSHPQAEARSRRSMKMRLKPDLDSPLTLMQHLPDLRYGFENKDEISGFFIKTHFVYSAADTRMVKKP